MSSTADAQPLPADKDPSRDAAGVAGHNDSFGVAPWGAYRPDFISRSLLALTRHTPLGRGRIRGRIHALLQARHPGPMDCELYGQPMRAYLGGNRCEWKAVLNPSQFDPQERGLIAEALDKPKAVLLDIGANVGVHALAAANHVRPDARIIAFEPHPATYGRLAFNLSINPFKGFVAMPVALGAEEGHATMSGDDLSLSTLAIPGEGPRVRVRPLITCLAELGIEHIDVMKIDVEGFEPEVLRPFLAAAPDALVPRMVIIEHFPAYSWDYDCIAALGERGLEVVARYGNNAILKMRDRQVAGA